MQATAPVVVRELYRTNMSALSRCRLVNLPKISDPRGNLTFVEGITHVPFEIKRVYYTYDVPGGVDRGAHAHKALEQMIIAVAGSFSILLDDGFNQKRFHLSRPFEALYICPMIWRVLDDFSSGSVCLVLASHVYDEDDYYRNYADFVADARKGPDSDARTTAKK
jgi:hypothetical protein